jgi:hypothetical protein
VKTAFLRLKSYWTSTDAERHAIVNGCGTGTGWKALLVPETIRGLSIHEACDIHDWMYALGLVIEDKDEADRVFLNNMIRIIDSRRSRRWLRALRLGRAKDYYLAVHWFNRVEG